MALTFLKELRKNRKLSLETVASDVDLSVSQISRYENGERDPYLGHLRKLADRFDVSVAELIGDPATRTVPVLSLVSAGKLRASHPVYESDVLREVHVADLPNGDWIALEIEGDSMNRVAPEGSIILINRHDQTLKDGRFYVFGNDQGEATFKRYRTNPERLQPFSTNPDHETHYLTDSMMLIGRAHKVITDLSR